MTIREVEQSLDMTRANIRFYEREGLLQPRREKNGYRDYTAVDLETLKKIKLLRQLHLSVDIIRQVQVGQVALADAVGEQEAQLKAQRADLEWAEEICRDLSRARVDYRELDAQNYLDRLARPATEGGYFSLDQDELPTAKSPWRRFFARWLDLCLYGLIWSAVQFLVLRWNLAPNLLITLLDSYIGFGLMFLLEPLLLSTWGYTPGKWIWGLAVRDPAGNRLTWSAAWTRTAGVFAKGLGYGIPIYTIVRYYKSYKTCDRGEPLEWEEETAYRLKDERVWRVLGFIGATAVSFVVLWLIILQGGMPVHRGAITPAEYADNINTAIEYYHILENQRMDENGQWVDVTPANTFVIDIGLGGPLPTHQLILTDGVVTGVRLEVTLQNAEWPIPNGYMEQKQLAVLAFAAAQREYNCITWNQSGVLEDIFARGLESYTLQAGPVTVTSDVTHMGFDGMGDGWLVPREGEPNELHMAFTLARES